MCLVLVYDLAQQIRCHGFRRRSTELSCFGSVFSTYRDHPASDYILASVRLAAMPNLNTSRLQAIWHLVSLSSASARVFEALWRTAPVQTIGQRYI
jgi:hypothetical protein